MFRGLSMSVGVAITTYFEYVVKDSSQEKAEHHCNLSSINKCTGFWSGWTEISSRDPPKLTIREKQGGTGIEKKDPGSIFFFSGLWVD